MLSLMFLSDGNSLLLDCLDQEKEKESEWPFHPVMTATGRQLFLKHTRTRARTEAPLQGWLCEPGYFPVAGPDWGC